MSVVTGAILILSGLFLVLLFSIFSIYSWGFFTTLGAPFIPIPRKILSKIVRVLDIKDNDVVYDLGCGDARMLVECYAHNPNAKYVGIEKSTVPIFLGGLKIKRVGAAGRIRILKDDFFKKDLSPATKVFVYLLPNTLDRLLPKLNKELEPGTKIVSYNFAFSNKKPEQLINLKDATQKISSQLYIYKF